MTTSDLEYPVLIVWNNAVWTVCADEDILTTCNSVTLRSRRLIGAEIVDASCRCVKIREIRFVSGIGSFWGFTFFDRLIRVEMALGDVRVVSLDYVKGKANKALRRLRSSVLGPEYITEKIGEVDKASDAGEIAHILLPHFDAKRFWQAVKKH